MASNELESALPSFAADVTEKFVAKAPGAPEDQLRAPFEALIKAAGSSTGKSVVAKGESTLADRLGRPDYAVLVEQALTGYVELKAPGHGANPKAFKTDHDKSQWKRFQSIPNLLYCDGNEWALYRGGERVGNIVRLEGDVSLDGSGAVGAADAAALQNLLTDFLSWEPIVPSSAAQLAAVLAPLCRLLRDQVEESLKDPESPLVQLASNWRELLFPDADDARFADAYAQTITYALLLARADGATSLDAATAAATLGTSHGLLARALEALTDSSVESEIGSSLRLLERTIEAVKTETLSESSPDVWLYFYETFLAEYDPKLRKDAGVYYTPLEVVRFQVRTADDLIQKRMGKAKGIGDPTVNTLDPAMGTGTYLLGAIDHVLTEVENKFGSGAVPAEATALARDMFGFEILVGPYAVAQLRLSREIVGRGGSLPPDGPNVYLTDTLEDPATEPKELGLFYRPIADEHRRAQVVKDKVPILLCIGNPPYDRHSADSHLGGWVRYGEVSGAGGPTDPPLLDDFVNAAKEADYGVHAKNLYNLYVYFWRWAIWKVFEQSSSPGPGIVSFITASSYLTGDAFVGMREQLRRECDAVWIVDLGGEGRGPRKDPNVFNIQLPVAIAIAVRYGESNKDDAADVYYSRIRGSTEDKLAFLDSVKSIDEIEWDHCPKDWQAHFYPPGEGDFFAFPPLTDVFPWQHSGIQAKRLWPIGPDVQTLTARWAELLAAEDRKPLFKETRDRKTTKSYSGHEPFQGGAALSSLPSDAPMAEPIRYAYRSLDRHYLIADARLIDYPRPSLALTQGDEQVYLTTLIGTSPSRGPAVMACSNLPDMSHFCGSFGAKHVIPLWRDADGEEANVNQGLLERLAARLGRAVSAEELLAYVYGILGSSAYTEHYWDELEIPVPRVPITEDPDLFAEVVDVGAELIYLHTFGERFETFGGKVRTMPHGKARVEQAIPDNADDYPESYSYDAQHGQLNVGAGVVAPVSNEVWEYEVSGYFIVDSWLGRRMKVRAGKKSSPLDDISPAHWTTQFTDELLELIWVLERTVALGKEQKDLLSRVLESKLLLDVDLPPVPAEAREPPETDLSQGSLFATAGEDSVEDG